MWKMMLMAMFLALVLTPSTVDAYGAAHVGYTHVGPNGVQHYGATAVRTPYGSYGGSHAPGTTPTAAVTTTDRVADMA